METQEVKDLVIARLQTIPEGKDISIGSAGEFNKQQLIEHVERGDEIGRTVIQIEIEFLRDLKNGFFHDAENIISHTA